MPIMIGDSKVMKKSGFTLIELLAVIVVLAVVLAIAVPTVVKTIEQARQKSMREDAITLVKTIELEEGRDEAFNVEGVTVSNLYDQLRIDTSNYSAISVSKEVDDIYITITGKAQWKDYTACGTKTEMKIVKTINVSDCDL